MAYIRRPTPAQNKIDRAKRVARAHAARQAEQAKQGAKS